jgi:hypothetical protein
LLAFLFLFLLQLQLLCQPLLSFLLLDLLQI